MSEREPRWFTYLHEDENGLWSCITIGPLTQWMALRRTLPLFGEQVELRLVWSGEEEPGDLIKDAVMEGKVDGRRKYLP